jgi:hypothetical protein
MLELPTTSIRIFFFLLTEGPWVEVSFSSELPIPHQNFRQFTYPHQKYMSELPTPIGSIRVVPTEGPREASFNFIRTSNPMLELPTTSIGIFFFLLTEGPRVRNFLFVRTSDPPSKLPTIHLHRYIPVVQPPQTLTLSF